MRIRATRKGEMRRGEGAAPRMPCSTYVTNIKLKIGCAHGRENEARAWCAGITPAGVEARRARRAGTSRYTLCRHGESAVSISFRATLFHKRAQSARACSVSEEAAAHLPLLPSVARMAREASCAHERPQRGCHVLPSGKCVCVTGIYLRREVKYTAAKRGKEEYARTIAEATTCLIPLCAHRLGGERAVAYITASPTARYHRGKR